MREAPPQSLMGWQEVQCLAELADVILRPVGIGLVEEPAPKHTHGEGLRGHPGHRGGGLGLVGTEGRSPEPAVRGVAAAVAREGGAGRAAKQAYKKGEKAGEPPATVGSCVRTVDSHQNPGYLPPGFSAKASVCPWLHFISF